MKPTSTVTIINSRWLDNQRVSQLWTLVPLKQSRQRKIVHNWLTGLFTSVYIQFKWVIDGMSAYDCCCGGCGAGDYAVAIRSPPILTSTCEVGNYIVILGWQCKPRTFVSSGTNARASLFDVSGTEAFASGWVPILPDTTIIGQYLIMSLFEAKNNKVSYCLSVLFLMPAAITVSSMKDLSREIFRDHWIRIFLHSVT